MIDWTTEAMKKERVDYWRMDLTTNRINGREAWRLCKTLNEMKVKMETGQGNCDITWTAEPAGWKKPHLRAGGRAAGLLRRKGMGEYKELKPDFGPPVTRIYLKKGDARPKKVCVWTPQRGYEFDLNVIKTIPTFEDTDEAKLEEWVQELGR